MGADAAVGLLVVSGCGLVLFARGDGHLPCGSVPAALAALARPLRGGTFALSKLAGQTCQFHVKGNTFADSVTESLQQLRRQTAPQAQSPPYNAA